MQKERKENKKMFLIHSKVERSMKAMGKKKNARAAGLEYEMGSGGTRKCNVVLTGAATGTCGTRPHTHAHALM